MTNGLKPSAEKVRQAVLARGFNFTILQFDETTRTSADAAAAIGCHLAQIAKSVIFRLVESDRPLLVLASGVNRVDEKLVGDRIGETLGRADAEFVRQHTGYVIGGVPPVGHLEPIRTLIDKDLLHYTQIWAAAGTPNAVFPLTPDQLCQLTAGEIMKIHT